ncbi:MAG: hypothetical protein DHS20C21_06820 [Gemmatimonadota bacterium]|nr:MAG: hypothetical protein DHS20C21_06820 [Gemmatimonadota bacterium]
MWKSLIAAALLLTVPCTALAIDEDQWIHVAMQDGDENVRINLPLTVVAAVLPMIQTDEFHGGRVRIDDMELDQVDLIAMLKEIRKAKDGEYVSIDDGDESVRVRKRGEYLEVHVKDGHKDPETVDLKIPMEVLDALTSGEDDELDLMAAIEVLAKYEGEDLVTVNDNGSSIRIWIDRNSEN